jgi:hypothetical protein
VHGVACNIFVSTVYTRAKDVPFSHKKMFLQNSCEKYIITKLGKARTTFDRSPKAKMVGNTIIAGAKLPKLTSPQTRYSIAVNNLCETFLETAAVADRRDNVCG